MSSVNMTIVLRKGNNNTFNSYQKAAKISNRTSFSFLIEFQFPTYKNNPLYLYSNIGYKSMMIVAHYVDPYRS